MPSVPGCVSWILLNNHDKGGVLTSFIRTIGPAWISQFSRFHLLHCWHWCKYSRDQRCQKFYRNLCTYCHRNSRFTGIDSVDGFGYVVRGGPIIKCLEVRNCKSQGSDEIGVIEREFRIASICMRRVSNSSYLKLESFLIQIKWVLTALTAASHKPPWCGALGGIRCQQIPWLASLSLISCRMSWFFNKSANSFSSRWAPTKFRLSK